MLNTAGIVQALNDKKLTDCKDELLGILVNVGFTEADLAAISGIVDNLMKVQITEAEVQVAADEAIKETMDEMKEVATDAIYQAKRMEEKAITEAHTVFNAKSSINLTEPPTPNTMFTSPVNIANSDYSTKDDHPNSYGYIDSIKNWFKINQKTRQAEFVHSSGCQLKIDKDGNVTMYITGNLKQVVDGDYTLHVRGGFDSSIGKGFFNKVGGDVVEQFGGAHNTTVAGVRTEKASLIHHN